MTSLPATLSLDLDDKWAYVRTHGDPRWQEYPTYLPEVAPRIVDFLAARDLRLTAFVVGCDAERATAQPALNLLVSAGHEIGNHSKNHYPWLRSLPEDEIVHEVVEAELAIENATGVRCRGFRAPGFSGSPSVHQVLASRGYDYDASSFPTFLGPLARIYCRLTASLWRGDDDPRRSLFGGWRDGMAPLKPHLLGAGADAIVEIPVTTAPILRAPFHMTYLLFLRQKAGSAWRSYLRLALALCAARGVAPSMLLHPLDFLGCEDEPDLAFFPGMKLPRAAKLAVVDETLDRIGARHRIATLGDAAEQVRRSAGLVRAEDLAEEPAIAAAAAASGR
ncbi:MAG TPA: polysaccharide deacetylase family protein [Lacipirellulaceae bacterium]|nr:polysaccharide deacetylase family protein [Lacipirellulaceae bacterium]